MDSLDNLKKQYDTIIIGAGHNGLVAAGYLTKSGLDVLVLEKREIVGGAAVTEELIPGFKFSSLADSPGALSDDVAKELNLAQFGYEIIPSDVLVLSLNPEGDHLTLWEDINRSAAEIAQFSEEDASAYPEFISRMRKISQIISQMNNLTPPDVPDIGLNLLKDLTSFIGPVLGLGRKNISQAVRVLPMSVADLLNEWFESELLKGTLAAPAINYLSLGPQEINSTAFNFLYNWSNSNTNLFRPGGVIKGGIGMLTQAIASSAESLGATILTGVEVSRITVQDGRATGVSLTNGKTISAKTIVSATDPRTTFTKLADPYFLGAKINKHVQNIKYRGTMGRVHFALDKLPAFSGVNQNPEKHLSGHIQISPSIEYLQKAYDPSKYGQFSKQPFLDIKIPSIVDSSLAPPGKHAMSVTVKFMPFTLKEGTWNEHRVTLGKLVINTLNSFTEDFEECIREYRVITPLDMESIYGLPEGHPSHGEMTLNQFMWMRPIPGYAQYRSPVDGLYLCSAATHPGGGVTGINGRNASRKILNDMG